MNARLHDAMIVHRHGSWCVEPVWCNVDRPSTGGWHVGDLNTAERLARAIRDGKVCLNPRVTTDTYGRTHVAYDDGLPCRSPDAALRMLGYRP